MIVSQTYKQRTETGERWERERRWNVENSDEKYWKPRQANGAETGTVTREKCVTDFVIAQLPHVRLPSTPTTDINRYRLDQYSEIMESRAFKRNTWPVRLRQTNSVRTLEQANVHSFLNV